jgi:hypothetical protein
MYELPIKQVPAGAEIGIQVAEFWVSMSSREKDCPTTGSVGDRHVVVIGQGPCRPYFRFNKHSNALIQLLLDDLPSWARKGIPVLKEQSP